MSDLLRDLNKVINYASDGRISPTVYKETKEEFVEKYDKLIPEVPQFVADWYEENKDNLEVALFDLSIATYKRLGNYSDLTDWFAVPRNKPIETIINMKNGYTLKKRVFVLKSNYKLDDSKYVAIGQPQPLYLTKDDNLTQSKRAAMKITEEDTETVVTPLGFEYEEIK